MQQDKLQYAMDSPIQESPNRMNGKIKKKLSWLKGLVKPPPSSSPQSSQHKETFTEPSLSRRSSLASFKDLVQKNLTSVRRSNSSLSLGDAMPTRVPTQILFPSLSIEMVRQTPKIYTRRLPPLLKAVYTGDLKKVNALLTKDGSEVNEVDPLHGFAPLHLAVEMEASLIIRELLGNEMSEGANVHATANPDIQDIHGRTPLMLAVAHESTELMGLFLKAHADPNAADTVGCSPLHYCLLTENLDCMRILLEYDANLQVFDKSGKSLLHHSVLRQKSRIAIFLIEQGCDVNALDSEKRSPLHEAVAQNLKSVTHLLLEKGADRNTIDAQGKKPVDLMAFQSFDQELFDELVRGQDTDYFSHDYLANRVQGSSPEPQSTQPVESLFMHYENVKRQSFMTESAADNISKPGSSESSRSDVVSFGDEPESAIDACDNLDGENAQSSSSDLVSFDEETDSEMEQQEGSLSVLEPSLRLGLTTQHEGSENESRTDDDFEISGIQMALDEVSSIDDESENQGLPHKPIVTESCENNYFYFVSSLSDQHGAGQLSDIQHMDTVTEFLSTDPLAITNSVKNLESLQSNVVLAKDSRPDSQPHQRFDSLLIETTASFHTALDHTVGNISFDSAITGRALTPMEHDGETSDIEVLDSLSDEVSIEQKTPVLPLSFSAEDINADQTPTIRSLNELQDSSETVLDTARLFADLKLKDESIAELSQQAAELRHTEAELKNQISSLTDQLKILRSFSKPDERYEEQLKLLETQIREEKALRRQLMAENQDLSEKCNRCQDSLEKLETQYQLEIQQFNEMKDSEDRLVNSIQTLKKKLGSSQLDLQETGKQKEELESIIENQEKQLTELMSKVAESEVTSETLQFHQKELAVAKIERSELESDLARLSRELDKMLHENKTLIEEHEYLKTVLDETEAHNRNLQSERNEVLHQLKAVEKEKKELSEDLMMQTSRSSHTIEILKSNYESLISDLEEKNQRVDECISRLQTLASRSESKMKQLESNLESLQINNQDLKSENSRLSSEIEDLKRVLSNSQGLTFVERQQQTKEFQAKEEMYIQSLSEAETKIIKIQSQLNEAKTEWSLRETLLLEEIAEYRSKATSHANAAQSLYQAKLDNEKLREILLEKDLNLESLQTELRKAQSLLSDSQVLLNAFQESQQASTGKLPPNQENYSESLSEQENSRFRQTKSQSEKSLCRKHPQSLGANDEPLTRSMLEDPQMPLKRTPHSHSLLNASFSLGTKKKSNVILSATRKPLECVDLDLLSPKVALILLRRRQRVTENHEK